VSHTGQESRLLVLDSQAEDYLAFYRSLSRCGEVVVRESASELLEEMERSEDRLLLLDAMTLKNLPCRESQSLLKLRGKERMALITGHNLDEFLAEMLRWGLLHVFVKTGPLEDWEVRLFLDCLRDSRHGCGLHRYLHEKILMHSISVSTMEEKKNGVERVINHFATADYEIHDLYDVRLILEEALNNSFFHAFKTATGEEKYHINTFKKLAPGEEVRIEFGSNKRVAGFTVTDFAGSLPVKTLLGKLERQLNQDGLLDTSGRGLYLSRMLTTTFVINIEAGKRTQFIALFDERRKTDRPKPFLVNYIGPESFSDWCREEPSC